MQGWNDYHLAWNESDYAGVKSIRIPAEILWKPDVLMYNRSSQSIVLSTYKYSVVAEMGDRLATTDMGRKEGRGCCAPFGGGAGSPSKTMWPGPRSTFVPSGILIHPVVWTQQTYRHGPKLVAVPLWGSWVAI